MEERIQYARTNISMIYSATGLHVLSFRQFGFKGKYQQTKLSEVRQRSSYVQLKCLDCSRKFE